MENCYDFVEDQVEAAALINIIRKTRSLKLAKERLDKCKHYGPRNLATFDAPKQQIVTTLRRY
jgi:hypothetical protein